MATVINEYTKYGTPNLYCEICAKRDYVKNQGQSLNAVINKYKGKLTGKPVIYFKQCGTTKAICMDCIKLIYEQNFTDKYTNPE